MSAQIVYNQNNYKNAREHILETGNVIKLGKIIHTEIGGKIKMNELMTDFAPFLLDVVDRHLVERSIVGKSKGDVERAIIAAYINRRFTTAGRSMEKNLSLENLYKYQIGQLQKQDDNSSQVDTKLALSNIDIAQEINNSLGANVHEIQHSDVKSIFGKNDRNSILKTFNPDALLAKAKIMLDSRYRDITETGKDKLSWNIIHGRPVSDIQGNVSFPTNIDQIKSIKMMPTRIPYNLTALNGNYNRISIFIEQLPTTSIMSGNRRYHFLFGSQYDSTTNFIDTYPLDASAPEFNFVYPSNLFDRISLSFAYPIEPFIFDTDRQDIILSNTGAITEFTAPSPHNLSTGDVVYFSNFAAGGTTSTDLSINSQINSIHGLPIGKVNDFKFTVNVNTIGMTPLTNPNKEFSCYYGSKRVLIELEVTYYNYEQK